MNRHGLFPRKAIRLERVATRGHEIRVDSLWPLAPPTTAYAHPDFPKIVDAICEARSNDRPVIPVTCHVSIGCDIIHTMANCSGAALGETSYVDFLIFARAVQDLEGGVLLNIGTAVTGPEVFLKALSMGRNVARQNGLQIRDFTTAVFDLRRLPRGSRVDGPTKDDPLYYYRPWKTILSRAVANGGRSFYFCGNHLQTIPSLWHQLVSELSDA
jgi:hypothetical protein